jgi:hypothetical protein
MRSGEKEEEKKHHSKRIMRLEEVLEKINTCIDTYEQLDLKFVTDQSQILRDLTTALFNLEKYRVEAYERWHSVYFQSQGKSVAAKEREADMKVPELYQIRRIMTGGYKVVESIRSTISIYKKEN